MRAEVVAVGTELLLGDIANTNAQEIGAMLAGIGVDCHIHTAVGDNEERIALAVGDALGRAGAVVVTGGLGPTQDDVTREALARLTGTQLVRDADTEARLRGMFERLGRPMPAINLRQADRPEHAAIIEARIGTAPGLIVQHDGGVIYAIPGVPSEMREMMTRAVLPDLSRRAGPAAVTRTRVLRVAGLSESGIAETLAPLWDRLDGTGVTLAYLAGGGQVRVRLTAKAADAAAAEALIAPAESSVRELLGIAIVGGDEETLEVVVGALMRARDMTIAVAESMTGGGIAQQLTRATGASNWFVGGVVAYTAEAKTKMLGVDPDLIEREGIVSEAVAAAMAAGARDRFDATIGAGITGAAGPESHGGRPAGTVCIAVATGDRTVTREIRLPGDRGTVQSLAIGAVLNLIRLTVLEEPS